MDLIDKYLGEKESFPKGRKAYTPGDVVKVISGNKKYIGKKATVTKNLMTKTTGSYHIEVKLEDGKELVYKNDQVELVKARKL